MEGNTDKTLKDCSTKIFQFSGFASGDFLAGSAFGNAAAVVFVAILQEDLDFSPMPLQEF